MGRVRESAHWLLSGVIRKTPNSSGVLVNHGGLRRLGVIQPKGPVNCKFLVLSFRLLVVGLGQDIGNTFGPRHR